MPGVGVIKQPFGESAEPITQITNVNTGTVATATGLSVVEQGDAVNHKTVLTLTDFAVGSAVGAADLCFGALMYTLPVGAQIVDLVYFNLAVTGTTTIVADTPEIGVGSVLGAGAQATIGAAGSTMEDYSLGLAYSAGISGATALAQMVLVTAGAGVGIALNVATSAKTFYLNAADGWAGAGDVTATGTVHIIWKMSS